MSIESIETRLNALEKLVQKREEYINNLEKQLTALKTSRRLSSCTYTMSIVFSW